MSLSPVSVMTPIANCSLALPATLNACCIRSSNLNASINHYTQSLRQRSHNCQLPDRTSVLRDKNFISLLECCIVMLFTGNYIFSSYSLCNGVLSAILLKLKWNEMRRYDLRPTRSCVSTFHTRVYAANCWSQSDKTHTTTTRSHS